MAAILFSAAAQAFQVGLSLKPASPALRTTSPAMFAPGTELATTLPTITAIAEGDDTTLFLASGGLIFFIFLFAVRLSALECTWLLLLIACGRYRAWSRRPDDRRPSCAYFGVLAGGWHGRHQLWHHEEEVITQNVKQSRSHRGLDVGCCFLRGASPVLVLPCEQLWPPRGGLNNLSVKKGGAHSIAHALHTRTIAQAILLGRARIASLPQRCEGRGPGGSECLVTVRLARSRPSRTECVTHRPHTWRPNTEPPHAVEHVYMYIETRDVSKPACITLYKSISKDKRVSSFLE